MSIISLEELKAQIEPLPPVQFRMVNDLCVGDKVTFVNINGVAFDGHVVIGFDPVGKYGRYIYTEHPSNGHAYWLAHTRRELVKEYTDWWFQRREMLRYFRQTGRKVREMFECAVVSHNIRENYHRAVADDRLLDIAKQFPAGRRAFLRRDVEPISNGIIIPF